MRGVSELYGALILLAVTLVLIPPIVRLAENQLAAASKTSLRPIKVLDVNETHAVCYTVTSWDPRPWIEKVNLTYLVYVADFDGDGFLDPIPGDGGTVPPGRYLLVSPPWVCRG